MSSLVSASTPSRFAFASAALNLASPSCSTGPESSREGIDAGVADGLCSGFFGGSGGTGLSVVGSGSLLGGLDGFTMLGLMCFGTLPIGGVGFPTGLESSREGIDADVADGLCSGFFGVSGGTGLSVVGSGRLLGGLEGFTMLGLMCFGTLPMGAVGFPKLALVNFGGLGRDGGCQFDRTGCAYAA